MLDLLRTMQGLSPAIVAEVTSHASTGINYVTSSRTFTGMALGDDDVNRVTVVAYCGACYTVADQYPVSVVVGGRNASLIGIRQYGGSHRYFVSLWAVDSYGLGSTADIDLQQYRNSDYHAICVMRLITDGSLSADSFFGVKDTNPLTTGADVPSKGLAVCVAGAGSAFAWTGATEAQRFGPSGAMSLAMTNNGDSQSVDITGPVRGLGVGVWSNKVKKPLYEHHYSGYVSTSTGSSATFSAVPLGDARGSRRIIVSTSWGQNSSNLRYISGVTVGGFALTRRVRAKNASDAINAEVWDGLVPSGTTGNVVVTLNDIQNHVAISVYSTDRAFQVSSAYAAGATSTSSVDVPTLRNSFVIGAFGLYLQEDATALTGINERYRLAESSIPSNVNKLHVLGDAQFNDAQTVTVTGNGTATQWRYLCAASYS